MTNNAGPSENECASSGDVPKQGGQLRTSQADREQFSRTALMRLQQPWGGRSKQARSWLRELAVLDHLETGIGVSATIREDVQWIRMLPLRADAMMGSG